MFRRIAPVLMTAAAAFTAHPGVAASFLVDSGRNDGISMTGVGMSFHAVRIRERAGWNVDLFWKPRVAYWHASGTPDLWDVGITPAFRFSTPGGFFGEAALGAHLLSHTRIGGRELSTAFQFGEQLAAGFTFGRAREYALALRAEHVSNGGIRQPNDGITVVGLELQVALP
ncbi:MAG TPA: acyloxyacyl hydrolase [Usitatibacter sp.]|nr:acyloxyacyl hydrolase [Usitatibacter sp.]